MVKVVIYEVASAAGQQFDIILSGSGIMRGEMPLKSTIHLFKALKLKGYLGLPA